MSWIEAIGSLESGVGRGRNMYKAHQTKLQISKFESKMIETNILLSMFIYFNNLRKQVGSILQQPGKAIAQIPIPTWFD